MTARFAAATEELRRWRDIGFVLPVWWRDDDAVAPTPALDRLVALAAAFGAPLHLAVVPEPATPELAERLHATTGVFVVTHGWRHKNHAPAGQKKAEFGAHRPVAEMLDEISRGQTLLGKLFGERALPVFTPPWNRVSSDVVSRLHSLGFDAISTFLPRPDKFAAQGLLQVNTHLDPIAWKAGGGLLDQNFLDAQIAEHLRQRRTGASDNAEPYGILTHHLVHDEAIWSFTEAFLALFAASGVARWTSPVAEARA